MQSSTQFGPNFVSQTRVEILAKKQKTSLCSWNLNFLKQIKSHKNKPVCQRSHKINNKKKLWLRFKEHKLSYYYNHEYENTGEWLYHANVCVSASTHHIT